MENKKVPGKYSNPIQNFLEYRKAPLAYFQNQFEQYGDFSFINMFGKNVYLVVNPEAIDYVLQKNASNYLKGRTTQKLRTIIGNGLITAEGKSWKKQNTLVRKSFSFKKVKELAPLFRKYSLDLCKKWEDKTEIDILDEMNQISLEIIYESLFHQQIGPNLKQFIHDVHVMMDYIVYLTRSIIPVPTVIPTKRNREYKQSVKRLNSLISEVIHDRKKLIQLGQAPNDILSLLLNKETEGEIDNQQIRDEIITLLMAGHETITNTLTFTFILLCENPEYFEELYTLSEEVFKDGVINTEILEGNNIARKVLNEAMRLYPPVWVFMRENIKEDEILGYKIPPKSMVIVAPYYVQRASKFWDAALTFKPNRFEINVNADVSGVKFLPFGHGPRICLGNNLAYIEAQVILLSICNQYKLKNAHIKKQELDPGITIRAINNRKLQVRKR